MEDSIFTAKIEACGVSKHNHTTHLFTEYVYDENDYNTLIKTIKDRTYWQLSGNYAYDGKLRVISEITKTVEKIEEF